MLAFNAPSTVPESSASCEARSLPPAGAPLYGDRSIVGDNPHPGRPGFAPGCIDWVVHRSSGVESDGHCGSLVDVVIGESIYILLNQLDFRGVEIRVAQPPPIPNVRTFRPVYKRYGACARYHYVTKMVIVDLSDLKSACR